MIIFNKIRYKNILSTGNSWTEINLNKNNTTLIVGENGAGKSTMLDALSFALYGKPFRKINKPQLINTINQRELMVEVEFTTGNKNYVVKRGMKPNVFEIWNESKLINQDAAARDYQEYLEENILKLNYKSFGQVVVLGSSTFVPFMQLPAKARRDVIEDLLDIQIFTTMNTLLKEKANDNKENLTKVKYDIDLTKNKITSAREHNESIRRIKENQVHNLKSKLKEQVELIESEDEKVNTIMSEVETMTKSISDKPEMKRKLSELQNIDRDLSTKEKILAKEVMFYEKHDNCPTCKQGIEHEFKDTVVSKNNEKVDKIADGRTQIASKVVKIEERLSEIEEIESQISTKNLEMSGHNANRKMALKVCKEIKKDLEDAEKEFEEVSTENLDTLEEELNSFTSRHEELSKEKEIFTTVGMMLKDGGIKTRIVKQYVPIMNKLINKYLAAMDFFVQFELDENFNETIKSRFRDAFSYSSFSEGEKLRIDLALLFTWRAVSKLRNSVSTNLLVMDEIMDSSLDNNGTEEFLKIIKELTSDTNVFIISHKGDQIQDKFDSVIKFEKVKNFSRMT